MSLDFSQQYDAPIVTTSLTPQDEGEISLRPKLLADYTGQEKAKGNLSVYIEAARRRNEPLAVSYTHLVAHADAGRDIVAPEQLLDRHRVGPDRVQQLRHVVVEHLQPLRKLSLIHI